MQKLLQVKSVVLAVVASAIFMVHTPVVNADDWEERQRVQALQALQEKHDRQVRDAERQVQEAEWRQRDAERRQQEAERRQRDAERKARW